MHPTTATDPSPDTVLAMNARARRVFHEALLLVEEVHRLERLGRRSDRELVADPLFSLGELINTQLGDSFSFADNHASDVRRVRDLLWCADDATIAQVLTFLGERLNARRPEIPAPVAMPRALSKSEIREAVLDRPSARKESDALGDLVGIFTRLTPEERGELLAHAEELDEESDEESDANLSDAARLAAAAIDALEPKEREELIARVRRGGDS